jgi:hypothetical protein
VLFARFLLRYVLVNVPWSHLLTSSPVLHRRRLRTSPFSPLSSRQPSRPYTHKRPGHSCRAANRRLVLMSPYPPIRFALPHSSLLSSVCPAEVSLIFRSFEPSYPRRAGLSSAVAP